MEEFKQIKDKIERHLTYYSPKLTNNLVGGCLQEIETIVQRQEDLIKQFQSEINSLREENNNLRNLRSSRTKHTPTIEIKEE